MFLVPVIADQKKTLIKTNVSAYSSTVSKPKNIFGKEIVKKLPARILMAINQKNTIILIPKKEIEFIFAKQTAQSKKSSATQYTL